MMKIRTNFYCLLKMNVTGRTAVFKKRPISPKIFPLIVLDFHLNILKETIKRPETVS